MLFVNDSVGAMDVELQPGQPERRLRVDVAPRAQAVDDHQRLARRRLLQEHRRRRDLHEDHDRAAGELIGKANLAVTAAKPDRIYALVEAKPGGGFYRSDDAGQTWALVNAQGSLIQRPFYYTTLGADPTNADVVYAGAEGFFKSTDAGKTFTTLRTPHGDNHDIWINPKDGNMMIQSNDGGANVSFDGGRTWSSQMNQPTAEIYGVWIDNQFPYKLYGAQQDNTTIIITSQADPYDARRTGAAGPGARPVRSCRTRRTPTSSTGRARGSTA